MKNRLATLGLLAFLAVDLVLVWLALRPAGPSGQPLTAVTAPSVTSTSATARPSASTSTGPSRPSTSSTSGTTAPSAKGEPVSVLVSALDGSTAWRGKSGSCDRDGATLEVTSDAGASWTPVDSPARAVVRVQPLDEKRVFIIGAGADCTVKQFVSPDAGDTWQAPSSVAGNWARRLDDPTTVVTPKEPNSQACAGEVVLDLSRTSATDAQALCANGDLVATTDGGASWSPVTQTPSGVALSSLDSGGRVSAYVARIVGACDGVQILRVIDGRNSVVACVRATNPKAGSVALSVVEGAAWLVVGDETWVSVGNLRSWDKV